MFEIANSSVKTVNNDDNNVLYFSSFRVTAVYGGQGKVKVKKRLWGSGDEGDKKKYSFKYLGPEKAACLLEKALLSVKVGTDSWLLAHPEGQEVGQKWIWSNPLLKNKKKYL